MAQLQKVTVNSAIPVSVTTTKTLLTYSAQVSDSADLIAAVASKRIKVVSYALFTNSTTENILTFQSGAAGALWKVMLRAPSSASVFGANLAVQAPDFIFATAAGAKLNVVFSSAQATQISITYFADDAT